MAPLIIFNLLSTPAEETMAVSGNAVNTDAIEFSYLQFTEEKREKEDRSCC